MPATETTPACPLPTIWELPDDLWEEVEPIIDCFYPPARTGRPRADLRLVLDGIIYRLRSGCQWSQLPERFGASSTVHGWFQRFATDGLLEEIWAYLLRECEELGGVRWEWQALELRTAEAPEFDERGIEIELRETTVHGDLHGLNVLVNQNDEPILIDYGEVRRANAALDPVTLELSVVFHPAIAGRLGDWPTVAQAERWLDLDAYCENCPAEALVRTCRAWAQEVSAGEQEIVATGYAYSMRQLKYGGAVAPLATAVAAGAYSQLRTN